MPNTEVATKQQAKPTLAKQLVNNPLITSLSDQIKERQEYGGLTFPADYNPTNALMSAYLTLLETTNKEGKSVLETCTQTSIMQTLMDMVCSGLDMSKKQCYPIAYGNKLQCQIGYFGHMAMAHRVGAKTINSEVIYEGDTFEYHIENGVKVLDKHLQDFRSIDNDKIIGAYCVITMQDGSQYMEVMSISQIKKSWRKGYGYKEGSGVHSDFADMMAKKTVTSRACKRVVQQYGNCYQVIVEDQQEDILEADRAAEDLSADVETKANTKEFVIDEEEPDGEEAPFLQEG